MLDDLDFEIDLGPIADLLSHITDAVGDAIRSDVASDVVDAVLDGVGDLDHSPSRRPGNGYIK